MTSLAATTKRAYVLSSESISEPLAVIRDSMRHIVLVKRASVRRRQDLTQTGDTSSMMQIDEIPGAFQPHSGEAESRPNRTGKQPAHHLVVSRC